MKRWTAMPAGREPGPWRCAGFIIGLSERLGVTVPETDYASIGTLTRLAEYLARRTPC